MPSSNPVRDEAAPPSQAPVPAPATDLEDTRRVARVLTIHSDMFRIGLLYGENMRAMVFARKTAEQQRESFKRLGARHQETMLSPEFFYASTFIWKESMYVSAAALEAAGFERHFAPGGLNCNSLGRLMSRDKDAVHASTLRISAFAVFAEAYDLIERKSGKSRSIELCGTPLLHELMLASVPADPGVPLTKLASSASPNCL
jgi:hypothetical protein